MLVTVVALVACYRGYQCYPYCLVATVMWLYQKHFALLAFRIIIIIIIVVVVDCIIWAQFNVDRLCVYVVASQSADLPPVSNRC